MSPIASRRRRAVLAASLAAGLAAGLLVASPAQAEEMRQRITVTGSATVTVERDRAVTSFAVSVIGASAVQAQSQLSANVTRVRNALLQAGATANQLTTTGLSLFPEYEYVMNERPRLVGYRSTLTLQVRSTIARAAGFMDAALTAGEDSVTIQGISFEASNVTPVLKRLRAAAVRDARERAQDYAEAADVRVGRVRSIVEVSAPVVRPIALEKQSMAADLPIDGGSQDVSVTISVTFDLQP